MCVCVCVYIYIYIYIYIYTHTHTHEFLHGLTKNTVTNYLYYPGNREKILRY